jgi:hypothetical protein
MAKRYTISIEEVENGYVMDYSDTSSRTSTKRVIANDAEDLKNRIMAQIVLSKLQPEPAPEPVKVSINTGHHPYNPLGAAPPPYGYGVMMASDSNLVSATGTSMGGAANRGMMDVIRDRLGM